MKNKNFTQEIIIITMVLISSYLIYSNVKTIDLFIYLFTTKDIIGKEWIPFLVFLNITLLLMIVVILLIQIKERFRRLSYNYLQLGLCVLIILLLNIWTEQLNLDDKIIFQEEGWTIYPPLSALHDKDLSKIKVEIEFFKSSLIYVQIFLLMVCTVTSFITYKNRTKIVKN